MNQSEKYILSFYEESERLKLMDIYRGSEWTMMDILNTHHACDKNFDNTSLVLYTASRCGIHPSDITSLFRKEFNLPK